MKQQFPRRKTFQTGGLGRQPLLRSLREVDLAIVDRPVSALKPLSHNARTHSKRQIHQIAASIQEFGFNNPVLVDEANTIIAGHGRVEAAKVLGLSVVPTIRIEHLTDAQKRAYILADNRLALNAGWDPEILAIEFQHLADLNLTFDLEITGFETAEIDLILDGSGVTAADRADDATPPLSEVAASRTGDLWTLGDHRLICGDSRDADTYYTLLGADRARLVFGDPPYNVKVDGHVGGLGSIKHREFAMASGEMTQPQFMQFLRTVFRNSADVSMPGAIHYWCMDWRHMSEMLAAGAEPYSELKNLCIWNKNNGGMGSFYRSKHELIFVYKVGREPHINTIELGRAGRYRTNVWDYGGANALAGRNDLAMHPTVKPVALISDAIKDCSRIGDIVLDPFGGSGSTLIAAERTKRRARLIEIDPAYVDVTIKRWEQRTGRAAIHQDGRTYSLIAESRAQPDPRG